MKTKSVFLVVLMTCFIMTGFAAKDSYARKNACGKEMTALEIAERALDIQEIQNVMSYHALYGAPGGNHDTELELIWSQKRDDITFAGNGYIYKGPIEVHQNTYGYGTGKNKTNAESQGGQMMAQAAAGTTSFRTLTTPIIVVAGDGKTAKAFWYTIGWQAQFQGENGSAIWSMEKYAIDFIREDDAWKIWHFHVYNDWDVPMGKDLAQYTLEKSKSTQQMPAGGMQAKKGYEKYFTAKTFNEPYSLTRPPNPLKPRPPVAYCHFEDTFSYADE
jgi:SnoaL-like domain